MSEGGEITSRGGIMGLFDKLRGRKTTVGKKMEASSVPDTPAYIRDPYKKDIPSAARPISERPEKSVAPGNLGEPPVVRAQRDKNAGPKPS